MKSFFKHFLNKKQSDEKYPIQDEKLVKNTKKLPFLPKQFLNTRNIKDSIVLQYNEENHYADPLVDQRIEDNIKQICKSRYFSEYDISTSALVFGRSLIKGDLKGGSDGVRCKALAWCARFLSLKNTSQAKEFLEEAKYLGSCPEIIIAEAFIYSAKGDKKSALSILSELDVSISKTAAFRIITNIDGAEGAIKWLKDVGLEVKDLDSEEKCVLIGNYIQLENWNEAFQVIDTLTNDDMNEVPILYHWKAMGYLLKTVAGELRSNVLQEVPFNAYSFPLASDANSIINRRKAKDFFDLAFDVKYKLNLPTTALIMEEYSLWLQLKDPVEFKKGRERLEQKLHDSKASLHLVNLAIQFGIEIDLDVIEREIDRRIALHGSVKRETAIARFSIAFSKEKPEEVYNYIEQHKEDLSEFINSRTMEFLQIEALVKAGKSRQANKLLEKLIEEGLPKGDEDLLRTIISKNKDVNVSEELKEQFNTSNSIGDLIMLVNELEKINDWDSISNFAKILFDRTASSTDAELLATALINLQKFDQLVEFIENNSTLLEYSRRLQEYYCWALYYIGDLIKAKKEFLKLKEELNDQDYRSLFINLCISLGEWSNLNTFISNEWIEKDNRSAEQLIIDAQLAFYIESPHAKDLIYSAIEKGKDNPNILATSYSLATNAGWESDDGVFQWLDKARELSEEDGPIKSVTLEELISMNPEWNTHETTVIKQLSLGEIPIFLAAESLNKTLIQMTLFPSLANQFEVDPRRRGLIPAFSGKREKATVTIGSTIALDPTVLLTLSTLNLLNKVLDSFDKVYISHSTLAWLFEERQKVIFHQPSRIKNAHQIHHLVAAGILEKLNSDTVPDSNLAIQVGEDLAKLITEAKKVGNESTQAIVVRSYPVQRISSLMDKKVDLEDYSSIMSSCQAIVKKLREKGQITADQEKRALVYLQLQEKPWPNQPQIKDGAILYLDDITINYFLHLGLLEKMKLAGFRLIASAREINESNELISYENNSRNIIDIIEQIRFAIHSRIVSGQVKVCKFKNYNNQNNMSISNHPTVGLFSLEEDCEAVFIDDRFLNQHLDLNSQNKKFKVLCTLDLLDVLYSSGKINWEERLEYRTILRRAGYCFIPVEKEELSVYLNQAVINDGKVIESAELKAIRENILLIRMRSWLQLPNESVWLNHLIKESCQSIKEFWVHDSNNLLARARSNWILNMINYQGWEHCYNDEYDKNLALNHQLAFILSLLSLPNISSEVRNQYWDWIEEEVLIPIKDYNPDLYKLIIQWYEKQLESITNNLLSVKEQEK